MTCKECLKRGIGVKSGEPVNRCPKRVEIEINFDTNTCVDNYGIVERALAEPKSGDLKLSIVNDKVRTTLYAKFLSIEHETIQDGGG